MRANPQHGPLYCTRESESQVDNTKDMTHVHLGD